MDGNGRWAKKKGALRIFGHRNAVDAVREVTEGCGELGIKYLTLYAFSSDNWRRPAAEVATLMALFRNFLKSEVDACRREGVRLSVIGRRDRLSPALVRTIEQAEATTAGGQVLNLRLAVDYSSRDAILRAAHRTAAPARPVSYAGLAVPTIRGAA